MIVQITDMEIVSSILNHPGIWPDIAPETVEPFDVPYQSDCLYFLMDDMAGIIVFHPFRGELKIHPNVIPQKRGKAAYKAVEDAIQIVFEDYQSVYAEIDVRLKHVIRFARSLGFNHIESNDRELFVRHRLDS